MFIPFFAEMVAVEKDLNKMNAHKLIPVDMQCKKCLKTDFDTILHLNAHVIDCYGPTLNKQVLSNIIILEEIS